MLKQKRCPLLLLRQVNGARRIALTEGTFRLSPCRPPSAGPTERRSRVATTSNHNNNRINPPPTTLPSVEVTTILAPPIASTRPRSPAHHRTIARDDDAPLARQVPSEGHSRPCPAIRPWRSPITSHTAWVPPVEGGEDDSSLLTPRLRNPTRQTS